jgi:hypothetical protein
MPTLPNLIVFQIKLKCDDAELFVKGDIFALEDTIHPVKQDWVIKTTRPASGQLVADDYVYVFNVKKAGTFELSAVTPGAPEPIPVKFEIAKGKELGLVFDFTVARR